MIRILKAHADPFQLKELIVLWHNYSFFLRLRPLATLTEFSFSVLDVAIGEYGADVPTLAAAASSKTSERKRHIIKRTVLEETG